MHLLIKPASGLCNMRCRYCFYADEMVRRTQKSYGIMTDETLDGVVRRAIEASARDGFVGFMFQGGEPTLAGKAFYRTLLSLITHYNTARLPVHLGIQTNGLVLDDEWAEIFAQGKFLVGLSLDGTKEVHDLNRVDAAGEGTFKTVLRAANLLTRHKVDFNTLTVVTDRTARSITSIYNFFRKHNLTWQQYIPCLAPLEEGSAVSPHAALSPEGYGDFLCRLFDLWYADMVAGHYVYNRTFENYIGILAGRRAEECGMCGVCSLQYVLEADGGVYPCDFYVVDEYRLGNFVTDSIVQIQARERELGFVDASRARSEACTACPWFPLCRGGCRRTCEPVSPGAPLPPSTFCTAYRRFFPYAYDRMAALARQVR